MCIRQVRRNERRQHKRVRGMIGGKPWAAEEGNGKRGARTGAGRATAHDMERFFVGDDEFTPAQKCGRAAQPRVALAARGGAAFM